MYDAEELRKLQNNPELIKDVFRCNTESIEKVLSVLMGEEHTVEKAEKLNVPGIFSDVPCVLSQGKDSKGDPSNVQIVYLDKKKCEELFSDDYEYFLKVTRHKK